MRILLLYDNFVRDYRGLLLLKQLLEEKKHKVWIRAGWNSIASFARDINVDMIVTGQISENATHIYGKFAKENNLKIVINSSEGISAPANFHVFTLYNTTEVNDEIIDLQVVASEDLYNFIQSYEKIRPANRYKYKFIGFPRFDLSYNTKLREVEIISFKKKYQLEKCKKIYLYISSFLFDDAFAGVSEKDMKEWDIEGYKKISDELLAFTTDALIRFTKEILLEGDMLLIKRHPWDCSDYFEQTLASENCKIVENSEYIVPCLNTADLIFHTHSTSAIEAWIMDKKTISLQLEAHKETTILSHMTHEPIAYSFDDLAHLINNYPEGNLSKKKVLLATNKNDGMATYRLAGEISKLKPNPDKFKATYKQRFSPRWLDSLIKPFLDFQRKYRALFFYHLYDKGILKHDLRHIEKYSKGYDLRAWENQRAHVNTMYKGAIREFAGNLRS